LLFLHRQRRKVSALGDSCNSGRRLLGHFGYTGNVAGDLYPVRKNTSNRPTA
jgi:hypothetical protein